MCSFPRTSSRPLTAKVLLVNYSSSDPGIPDPKSKALTFLQNSFSTTISSSSQSSPTSQSRHLQLLLQFVRLVQIGRNKKLRNEDAWNKARPKSPAKPVTDTGTNRDTNTDSNTNTDIKTDTNTDKCRSLE